MAIIELEDIRPEDITCVRDLIRDINELGYEATIGAPDLNQFHTIWTGIRVATQIGWVGEMGLVGVARQGCDPTRDTSSTPVIDKFLNPKRWEATEVQCYDELICTIWEYARRLKSDEPDLIDTAYWNMVEDLFTRALYKMLWRASWFNDTTAQNVTDGGVITNGVPVRYFTWNDGLWKQYFALGTAEPNRRVTIPANAETTLTAQQTAMTADEAIRIATALKYQADIRLRGNSTYGAVIDNGENETAFVMCTRMFADKLEQAIIERGQYTESQYRVTENGLTMLRYNGLDFYPIDIWDEMIMKYEASGADATFRLNLPYRCVLTVRRNQIIAVPSETAVPNFNVWYDKTTRKNYIEAMDSLDAQYALDYMVQLAY